ncbi:hypothetical protein QA596_11460 [Balneolales bacterium ANBcel1]|nr:hypothetical protein [Balneolales bacterium ANBcel1]
MNTLPGHSALLSLLLALIAGIAAMPAPVCADELDHPVKLPAHFQNGLIFLKPVTEEGDTLRFFIDSADGSIIYEGAVNRLGLTAINAVIMGREQQAAFLPPFDEDNFIPSPSLSDGLLPVRADDRKPPHHEAILENADGILGSTWFAQRTWSIDYRRERIYLIPTDQDTVSDALNGRPENFEAGTAIPISFRDENGSGRYHFANLPVIVAGDTLSMVLKTGSTIVIDEEVRAELDHPVSFFPAGLITDSVFNRWRQEHPDWRIIENADLHYGSDLIEVPTVRIGSHEAGPVYFAVRRDEAFDDWFSQFTADSVVGALGPDAFRGARITISYPNELILIHE